MAAEFLNEIFQNRALSCNLRTNSNCSSRQVHSMYHGTELELVLEDTKQSESLKICKNKIKKWYLQDILVDYAVFIFETCFFEISYYCR